MCVFEYWLQYTKVKIIYLILKLIKINVLNVWKKIVVILELNKIF